MKESFLGVGFDVGIERKSSKTLVQGENSCRRDVSIAFSIRPKTNTRVHHCLQISSSFSMVEVLERSTLSLWKSAGFAVVEDDRVDRRRLPRVDASEATEGVVFVSQRLSRSCVDAVLDLGITTLAHFGIGFLFLELSPFVTLLESSRDDR